MFTRQNEYIYNMIAARQPCFVSCLIMVCIVLCGHLAMARESKEVDYNYYYKGSLISLTPSKRLIALEEKVPNLSSIVKDHQLVKDPLSEKYALKHKSLGLYRAPALKKNTERIDMGSVMASLSRSVMGQVQPVFEQGGSLLIPSDEVIAGFKDETSLTNAQGYLGPYLKEMGVIEMREHRKDTFILKIENPSNGRAFGVSKHLTALDRISFAEPNMIVVILGNQGSWNPLIEMKLSDEKFIVTHMEKEQNEIPLDVTAQAAPQWTTITSLNFESDDLPQGWQIGNFQGFASASWGPTTYRKHGGSRSLYCATLGDQAVNPPGPVPIKMNAVLRSPITNLSSYEEVYVELWFYAKNDLAQDQNGNLTLWDYPAIQVIDNNLQSYTSERLGIWYDGDCTLDLTTSNGWRRFLFRVPPSFRTANAIFQFTYISDEIDQYEGAYIDDIRIVGTSNVDTDPLSHDTYSARQYEFKNVGQVAGLVTNRNDLHVPEAWNIVSVSQDIIVAVIDGGVELTHPDLNMITGYDYNGAVGGQPRGNPRGSHGTNCAGNVGAIKDNGIGVVGTAPGVKVMPVYFGETSANLASAIDVAVVHGAHVLSNSWGITGFYSQDIENAIIAALSAGKIVLFAAGNGPDRPPFTYDVAFPGNLTGTTDVICVGASSPTDEHKSASSSDGQHTWGSSYVGDGPDVVAPGPWSYATDLLGAEGSNDGSAINPGDTTSADYNNSFGGTSSSTPKVAGIVALMLSKNPNLTPAQVKAILKESADDIDTPGIDDKTGAGRVNAFKAVTAVPANGGSAPVASFTAIPTTGTAPLTVNFTDTSTGTITNREWNFGDGQTSIQQNANISHTYTAAGTYSVTLTVTGPGGSDTESKANLITVTRAGGVVNLVPYKPLGWSDAIVVSKKQGTNRDTRKITRKNKIFLDFAVINNSDMDITTSFSIDLFVNEAYWDSFRIDSVLKMYYIYFEDYLLGKLPPGFHQIKLIADSKNEIFETDENDNIFIKNIEVKKK